MKPNNLKNLWQAGTPSLNGWLSIPNTFTAELLAQQAYDSITVDMQHGLIDYADMVKMLQAMRASEVTPVVRVPWLDPAMIMKALDAGAYGIVCPMINTRAQAEELVSYMRYPPSGTRSFGPIRALVSAGADYAAQANEHVICLAMIETAEAMENLDDIVATPGLDAVYIGPADLTLGLENGRLAPGFDREEPEMITAIQRVLQAAHDAGIKAGLHCGSPEYAKRAVDWGFDLVTLLNDARMLTAAAEHHVSRTRELLGDTTATAKNESSGY